MRLSVVLLLCALAGTLGGGALIGLPALGGCLIFDSLCVGVFAWARDIDAPTVHEAGRSVQDVLDRFRGAA